MPELQLSFHGTFALKKEDLIKILKAATEEQGLNDSRQGLMDRTGLGNEKVLRIKSWAIRSGLVSRDFLSPEGEIVFKQDPYLESPVTDWLMHFYLSFGDKGLQQPPNQPADWGGWTWFVYDFLPRHSAFTTENLVYESATVFEKENSKGLAKNFRYVLRAYTESEALAACRLLESPGKDKYLAGGVAIPNPYLVGYFLVKLWERDFGDRTSVLADDILNQKMGLAPILGIDTEALQEQLNRLEAFGMIEQWRTVVPFQVIRRWDHPLILLEQAYAEGH